MSDNAVKSFVVMKTFDAVDSIGIEHIESEILRRGSSTEEQAKQIAFKAWKLSVKKTGNDWYFNEAEFLWRPGEKNEKFKWRGYHPKGSLTYDIYEVEVRS